jgi:hypothetical protein
MINSHPNGSSPRVPSKSPKWEKFVFLSFLTYSIPIIELFPPNYRCVRNTQMEVGERKTIL